MERLTFDGNFCDIAQCQEMPCPHNGSCSQREVWEKLKAYEDTGITPESADALKRPQRLMQIKTVRYRINDADAFDWEVNAALRSGWILSKRCVIDPNAQSNICFVHTLLYAELVKEVAENE